MQIFLSVNSYEPLPGGGCWWPAAAVVALINPPMDILLFTGAGLELGLGPTRLLSLATLMPHKQPQISSGCRARFWV